MTNYLDTHSYVYTNTLLSKNKIKKFLLIDFLLNQNVITTSSISLQLVDYKNRHKNVFLNSPFHYKTVKSHLYIPSYRYTINVISNSKDLTYRTNHIFSNFALIGSLLHYTVTKQSYFIF